MPCHNTQWFRIEISRNFTDTLDLQIPYPEDTYQIKEGEQHVLLACISVNSMKRIPFGEPDPEEVPPRYPNTQPEYKLHLINSDEFRSGIGYGGFYLAIGKIVIGDTTTLDEAYIPSSMTVSSHPKLIDIQSNISHSFGQLRNILCTNIPKNQPKPTNWYSGSNDDGLGRFYSQLFRASPYAISLVFAAPTSSGHVYNSCILG